MGLALNRTVVMLTGAAIAKNKRSAEIYTLLISAKSQRYVHPHIIVILDHITMIELSVHMH